MTFAVRCPSCGHALFTLDSSPSFASATPPAPAAPQPSPNAPLLLRIPEAAELLGISRSTLSQLIAKGAPTQNVRASR
jgi:Bacterial regulatory protein, Fis family